MTLDRSTLRKGKWTVSTGLRQRAIRGCNVACFAPPPPPPPPTPPTHPPHPTQSEEEDFTQRIIDYFNNGLLPLPEGITLRAYLAEKLNW